MTEIDVVKSREEALAAAREEVVKFAEQVVKPDDKVTISANRIFGSGVSILSAVNGQELVTNNPPRPKEGYGKGVRWQEVYATEWPDVLVTREYFKRPGDEFNVEVGKVELTKFGSHALAKFQSGVDHERRGYMY